MVVLRTRLHQQHKDPAPSGEMPEGAVLSWVKGSLSSWSDSSDVTTTPEPSFVVAVLKSDWNAGFGLIAANAPKGWSSAKSQQSLVVGGSPEGFPFENLDHQCLQIGL